METAIHLQQSGKNSEYLNVRVYITRISNRVVLKTREYEKSFIITFLSKFLFSALLILYLKSRRDYLV